MDDTLPKVEDSRHGREHARRPTDGDIIANKVKGKLHDFFNCIWLRVIIMHISGIDGGQWIPVLDQKLLNTNECT